jgi:hypothetical protein
MDWKGAYRSVAGRSRDEYSDIADRHWFSLLVAGAALVVGLGSGYEFLQNPTGISTDSALFQHAGWYITEGATPYVDFWDLKPPLIYGVTTLLAALSGGNMLVLHVLSVLVAMATVVAGVVLVGVLVHRLTGDGVASLAAAGTMFVVPSVYMYPHAGIRPKYFAFLCAAGALVLAVDDRPAASGAVAAAAAGFWQLGAVVALLVAGMGLTRNGWRGFGWTVAGGLAVAVAVVAPFVLQGLAIPLFVEVVLAPVYAVERYTVGGRLLEAIVELGYGVLLVPLGVYGGLRAAVGEPRTYWWVGAGGVLYTLQVFLELQGAIETVLLVVFLAVGVGLLAADPPRPSRQSTVVAVVLLLAVGSFYWGHSPVTPVRDTVEEAQADLQVSAYETLPPDPPGVPSMQTIYWEQHRPDICHYRLGHKQKYFAHLTGESLTKRTCGQWPFAEPPGEWLRDRVPGI